MKWPVWFLATGQFCKFLIQSYLDYLKKERIKKERREAAMKQKERGQREGSARDMLQSFEDLKRNRDRQK